MTGTLGRKVQFSAFVVVGNKNGIAGKQLVNCCWFDFHELYKNVTKVTIILSFYQEDEFSYYAPDPL